MARSKNRHLALTERVTIRLSQEQFGQLNARFKTTTGRRRSIYLRSLILGEPVTFYTRNKSLDELMEILRQLIKALPPPEHSYSALAYDITTDARIVTGHQHTDVTGQQDSSAMDLLQDIHNIMQRINKIWLQD